MCACFVTDIFRGNTTTIIEGTAFDDSTNLPVEGVKILILSLKDNSNGFSSPFSSGNSTVSFLKDTLFTDIEGAYVFFSFNKDESFIFPPNKSKIIDEKRVFTDEEGRYTMSQTSKRGEVDDILVTAGHDSIRYTMVESSGSVDIGEKES